MSTSIKRIWSTIVIRIFGLRSSFSAQGQNQVSKRTTNTNTGTGTLLICCVVPFGTGTGNLSVGLNTAGHHRTAKDRHNIVIYEPHT